MPDTGANQAERQLLEQDAIVELWELDYSDLLGDKGNPSFIQRYCGATRIGDNSQPVVLNGLTYDIMPIVASGFKRKAGDKPVRPRVAIANGNGVTEKYLNSLTPWGIRGAVLIRKRIYAKHLDNGSEPDPYRVFEPIDRMIVTRLAAGNRYKLDYELQSAPDVEDLKTPRRVIDNELCSWAYRDATLGIGIGGCTWDRDLKPGPYFDIADQPSDLASDDCSRSLTGCALRHNATDQALPFGGFVTVGTSVR